MRVPEAFFGGRKLTPAQSAWRTPKGFTLVSAQGDRAIPQTLVDWSSTTEHGFVLKTAVYPTRATITVFARTELDTTPIGDGDEFTCGLNAASGCAVQVGDRETLFQLRQQVELPAAVVLDVGYASLLPIDAADGVTSYSASWVLRARRGVS